MELTDLIGEHVLTGVDAGNIVIDTGYSKEDCATLAFTLDGVTYMAVEDPDDGYRSFMRELRISQEGTKNGFAPLKVLAKMREEGSYAEENDVLELVDVKNGKVVVAVGTGDTNDYYPYWVADFTPENMSHND